MTLSDLLERRSHLGHRLPDAAYQPLAKLRGARAQGALVEQARALLAAGAPSPLVRELLERALFWVSEAADPGPLERIVRDRSLPVAVRTAAAEAVTELGVSPAEWLDPEDPDALVIALGPIDGALRQLDEGEAEGWLAFFAALGDTERDALPALLRHGRETGVLSTSLPRALLPLFAVESEPQRRRAWIEALVAHGSPEAAEVLAHWRDSVRERALRDEIRRALHGLARRGVAVPERRSGLRYRAWMSGCDGSGSYSLGFRIEGPALGPIHLLYTLNVTSGLRDATRIASRSLDPREHTAREMPVTIVDVPPSEAARRVGAALERSRSLGRAVPEGFADTEQWLAGVPSFELVPDAGAGPHGREAERCESLFASEEFASWFHAPGIAGHEIDSETRRAELTEMLRHQQRVYRLSGRTRDAAACERARAAVESGDWLDSEFGRCFVARSEEEARLRLEADAPLLPPFELRAELTARIDPSQPLTKRDLLALDLGQAALHALKLAGDSLPARARPREEEWVQLAEAIGRAAAARLARRSGARRRRFLTDADLDALAAAAERAFPDTGLTRAARHDLIFRALEVVERFGAEVCESLCPHGCVDRLDEPASALVFADEHPAASAVEGDPEGPEAAVLDAMDALGDLGVENVEETLGPILDSLEALAADSSSEHERLVETVMDAFRALLRSQLVLRASSLPAAPDGSDPATPSAAQRFEARFGEVPSYAFFARLANRVTSPTLLLRLLLHAAPAATLEDAQERADAFMAAWNHTPRAEFDGQTPAQRAGRG
jgi:hypothetical protein